MFASLAGLGAEGLVTGAPVLLGNHRLFEERGLCSPLIHTHLDAIGAQGRTPVLVARDGEAVGIIAIADRARETSRDTIDELRRHGVESVVMLTGDSHATARAIAGDVGVDEFQAELMPEDKVAAIAALRRRFGSVAMVGDGVNDAPALASADIGIAMGAAGERRSARNRGRGADGRRVDEDPLRAAIEPHDAEEHQGQSRDLARDEGCLCCRGRGGRCHALDGDPR